MSRYEIPRRRRKLRSHRRGATLVEGAIVLSVFLTVVLGLLDLGIAVSRYNLLSEAARQGTREAIVHGELAPPLRTVWGPASYSGTAADNHEIVQAVRPALVGMDPGSVSLAVTWPDGGNEPQMRVRYQLVAKHRLILTSLFTNAELTFSATSTMLIAH